MRFGRIQWRLLLRLNLRLMKGRGLPPEWRTESAAARITRRAAESNHGRALLRQIAVQSVRRYQLKSEMCVPTRSVIVSAPW